MAVKRLICLFGFIALVTLLATAQSDYPPRVELAGGYSYLNVNPQIITSQNFNGGGGAFVFDFNSVVGIKADFMGYTGGTGWGNYLRNHGYPITGSASGNLFTYMFGPQIKKHSGRFQPFAEALVGAYHSNAYATVISCIEGNNPCSSKSVNGSKNNFNMEFGGGLDIALSQHVELRPVEVDYLFTSVSADLVKSYSTHWNNFKYVGGLNFALGGKPPIPPSASCTASPTEVMEGDPVTVTATGSNFKPNHTVTYAWTTNGGKLDKADAQSGRIDTTGVAAGSYTANATITDPQVKKAGSATCAANFTVKARPMNPPQVSCSVNPTTVQSGNPATITATATSPDGAQITGYSYSSSAGRISGTGTSATLDTAGAGAGQVTVTVTATDARNLSSSATCSVGVEVPPPPPTCSKANAIQFPDLKRPWRVDNTAKAILDDVASRLKSDPNAKIVIIGYADGEKAPMVGTGKNRHPMNLAAQRAVNAKAYLQQQQGIDPSRVEVRTGTGQEKVADIIWVPQGADENTCADLQNTTPVDESVVKPSENAYPKPATAEPVHHKKAATAPQQ